MPLGARAAIVKVTDWNVSVSEGSSMNQPSYIRQGPDAWRVLLIFLFAFSPFFLFSRFPNGETPRGIDS